MFGSGLTIGQWWVIAAASAFLPAVAMMPYMRKAKRKKALVLFPLFVIVPTGIGALYLTGQAAARGYGLAESLEMYVWGAVGLALLIVLGRPYAKRNEERQAAGEPLEQPSLLYMALVFVCLGIAAVLAFVIRNYLIG